MDVSSFLDGLRQDPSYAGQIVHVHRVPVQEPTWAPLPEGVNPDVERFLEALGITRVYAHQADAIRAGLEGDGVLVTTGPASGKRLCCQGPIVQRLIEAPLATALFVFPAKALAWNGQVLWGMMMYDSLRAMDDLASRPEVDASRIGTLGLSMGSAMSWWLAALDVRVKVCVDICCLTDCQALIDMRNLDGHGLYYYAPGLLKRFDTASINALIAPRPHLALAGNYDKLTPPAGLDRVDAALKRVYAQHGAAGAWKLRRYEIGHFETAAMRRDIVQWLRKWI